MKKGFAHVFILLLLVIVGIAVYFLIFYKSTSAPVEENISPFSGNNAVNELLKSQPEEPSEMSGSRQEVILRDVFSLTYPDDVDVRDEGDIIYVSKWGPTQKVPAGVSDGIYLIFKKVSLGEVSLEDYVINEINKTKELDTATAEVLLDISPTSIKDYEGFTYTGRGMGVSRYIYIQSLDKTTTIEIIDATEDPTNQGFHQIVEEMLSTFTFK